MTDFLFAFFWGLCVFLATVGYGRFLQRLLLRPSDNQTANWLDAPSWGIATLALLGGPLNLFALARPPVLIAMTIAGILLLLFDLNRPRTKQNPTPTKRPLTEQLLLLAIITLLTLRFASTIILSNPADSAVTLNPHDDMHSYLLSLARLLQTGTVGLDPFNSRQMTNALGAQHFLNALPTALLPFDSVHLMDDGIGLLALTLSAAAVARRLHLPRIASLALMLIPLSFEWIIANISSNLTSAATLLALASSLLDPSPPKPAVCDGAGPCARTFLKTVQQSLPPALLLAATCSLKSTMIPAATLFLFFTAIFSAISSRTTRPLLNLLPISLLAFLLALPWMLWQYQSSATLLYPFLGRGDHLPISPPLTPFTSAGQSELLANLPLPLTILAGAIILICLPIVRRSSARHTIPITLAILLTWTLLWPLLLAATEYPDLWRYLLPIAAPALIIALAFLWQIAPMLASKPVAHYAAPAALLLTLLLTAPQWLHVYFQILPHSLRTSITYPTLPWTTQRDALKKLQQSIPPGEPFVAYLTTPALLDFNRNPIFVIDWPGESSPPPGLPVFDGPSAIADYLLHHHLRYLAYTYAGHANFYPASYKQFLDPTYGRTINRQTRESFAFQDALTQLAHTHRLLFNNGTDLVIDLATTTPTSNP